ncbi:MAG: hypothetical protein IT204_13820 [Fimbriimonadaceae bacterium]|nr:hypothetical protein [Fimbriimonadaceae bacterium]
MVPRRWERANGRLHFGDQPRIGQRCAQAVALIWLLALAAQLLATVWQYRLSRGRPDLRALPLTDGPLPPPPPPRGR